MVARLVWLFLFLFLFLQQKNNAPMHLAKNHTKILGIVASEYCVAYVEPLRVVERR